MSKSRRFVYLVRTDASRFFAGMEGRDSLKNWIILVLFNPGFQLAVALRIQWLVAGIPLVGKLLRRIVWYVSSVLSSSEINIGATFGEGIYFPHPTGVVVRGECVVGNNVSILQGVTIGRGAEVRPGSFALIEDGSKLNAGCKVIGDVRIGKNAVIGANAVVLQDVPDNAVAVGVPARIILKRTTADSEGES